jgi:hypothetical protein
MEPFILSALLLQCLLRPVSHSRKQPTQPVASGQNVISFPTPSYIWEDNLAFSLVGDDVRTDMSNMIAS